MKIVLDTNVYVAAFLKKSLASKILKFAQSKNILLYISPHILIELKRILKDKFKVENEDIEEFENLILMSATVIKPKQKLDIVKEDPTDNKILECAVEADANLIVTMDKHLIKLKKYKEIGIVHAKTLTWILPKLVEK